jgi:hypothetical protein
MTNVNWIAYIVDKPLNFNWSALKEQAVQLWGEQLFELNQFETDQLIFSFYPESLVTLLEVQTFVDTYNPDPTTDQLFQTFIENEEQLAESQIRVDLSVFKQKTYLQIKNMIQNEVDSWTTLALARAGLRVWLPVILAALIFKAAKDIHR